MDLKKIIYFLFNAIALIFSRTAVSSLCNCFSRFFSDAKLNSFNPFSRNSPEPRHPHVQTSFNICRQLSNASSFMEYGIQYPFLSLLIRPACLNVLRCWDTPAGVIPISPAIFLAPSGPLAFKSSIILSRVSTDNALIISEGSGFISASCYLIKYFSYYLIIRTRNKFVKCFFEKQYAWINSQMRW